MDGVVEGAAPQEAAPGCHARQEHQEPECPDAQQNVHRIPVVITDYTSGCLMDKETRRDRSYLHSDGVQLNLGYGLCTGILSPG